MAQVHSRMQPIGQLMIEHRLIGHVIRLMRDELDRIGEYGRADTGFINEATAFIKEYADICHHGKEESVLFRDLAEKPISGDLRKMLDDLVEDHILMRKLANDLVMANERYAQGMPEARADIISSLNNIIELYPRHIEKEDRHFFMPAMDYFSPGEKDAMLNTFREFDSRMFHDEYAAMVADMESRWRKPESATPR